jgi:preprotein translocase subunit YajC
MFKSKRGQDKQRQDLLASLKKGDRIRTIGGIIGTVVEAREDVVVVKVDETSNAKIHFVRSAIHAVVDPDKPAATSKA